MPSDGRRDGRPGAGSHRVSAAEGLAVYRANRPSASPGDLLAAVGTDWFFRIRAIRVAEARAASGTARTWVYRFDHPNHETSHRLGACHGAEIPFVFDTITREETHPRIGDTLSQAMADAAHNAWISFIANGTPGWGPTPPPIEPRPCSAIRSPRLTTRLATSDSCGDGIR